MAEVTEHTKTIQYIVKALSLDEFYPEKITSEDLYEITELSIKETESITPGTICWIFINRLTRNNYKARHLKLGAETTGSKPSGYLQRKRQSQLENVTQFHPLDIIAAVYVCCDPLAKQDLVRFMWACKMSVPFILCCDVHNSPIVYQWPLRALIIQWQENEKSTATEHSIIKYPMQKIGFIRIGDLDESKSALLNGILGGPEKAHPMFFHRDMYGSQKNRSILVEGLVELGWYFPKGVKGDRFGSCKLFANLRGDASKCPIQLDFLLQTMDLIIIISHTRYSLTQVDTFRNAVTRGKKVILILTDRNIELQNEKIELLLNHLGTFDDRNFEILPLEDERLASKLDFISDTIMTMENNTYTSLEAALSGSKIDLKIDEEANETIRLSVKYANNMIYKVEKSITSSGKNDILPLQGDSWKNWTKTEFEIFKLEKFSQSETTGDISSYINSLQEEKIKLRKQQYDMLEKLSNATSYFIQCISYLGKDKLKIFLRALKLGLDEISRKMNKPYYERYKRLLEQKMCADERNTKIINTKLEKLDKEKAAMSVGVEHFIRELGQIYEASATQGTSAINLKLSKNNAIPFSNLPYLASRILLGGYPIEIMDGDVGFVPEKWMTAVLSALRQELDGRNATLYIISILGIQSSGKSTLLNTLFGLQFAVSAGRCTKGVFMQMVKVSVSLRSRFKCDYVLAIDTEGLRAAKASTKFDHELSCFAIGLADLTVVNLMGENAKYLEENLPVVVHAFLRMDIAGLMPQCIIVHQNVDKTNKGKLMEQSRLLENVLDELTANACDMEGIQPHKRFKDIIRLNISDSTYYIPALLEGDQPMGPFSVGYSHECNELRVRILQHCEQKSRLLSITDFSTHLSNLWSAMISDQFVFNFRTTADTQTSLQLEEVYSEIHSSLLDTISTFKEEARDKIKRCFYLGEQQLTDIRESLTRNISKAENEHRQRLIEYIEDPNKRYSKIMLQWKEEKLQQFNSDFEDAKRDCMCQFEKLVKNNKTVERTADNVASCDISKLKEIVKEEIEHKNTTETESMIAIRIWSRCFEKRTTHCPHADIDTSFIKRDVEAFLLSIFDSEKPKLEKELSKTYTSENACHGFVTTRKHIPIRQQLLDKLPFMSTTNESETIANIIIKSARERIEHVGARKNTYTQTEIRRILLQMKTTLEKQKKNVTKDFKIDICIYVSKMLVMAFSDLYKKEKADETAALAHQKGVTIALIKKLLKKQKSEVQSLCAEQVTELVVKEVTRKTFKYLHCYSSSLNSLRTKSKQQCIDSLLGNSIISKAFELVNLYLTDPEEALVQMLMRIIRTDQLKKDALSDFRRRLCIFQVSVETFNLSGKVEVEEFILLTFKMSNLALPNSTYVKAIQAVDVDILKLRKTITERILSVKASQLPTELAEQIETHNEVIKRNVAEKFLNRKLGCLEKCPFCAEVCMYDTVKHVGNHCTAMHRPVGYNAIHCQESKLIEIDTCTTLVRSNATLLRNGNLIIFKDYDKFYPDWKILANRDISKLWKWYFAKHFKNELSKEYKVVVPTAWHTITEDEVVRTLIPTSKPSFYRLIRKMPE